MEIRISIERTMPQNEMVSFENLSHGKDFCVHAFFRNGYGISMIRNSYTYGGSDGLYEIAVLDSDGEIDYSTPITNDVIGWLTRDECIRYAGMIASL